MKHGKEETLYQEAVRYLYSLQKFGIKFGLSRTSNLLKAFGNPHKNQNYVHIAGTNGKGSVAAFVASVLKEAGIKVGLYSSPHLVRFTERFRINDQEISKDKATDLIEELKEVTVSSEPPTFFEATTTMALVYFAREETDIAIMEVGMGGRLDATNLINPLVSVITNISMEHQFFLGSRLLDIAAEKAGIIKEEIDVVTGATQIPVINLFKSICNEKNATFWRLGKDVRYRTNSSGFHYSGIRERLNGLQLGLKGHFQTRNGALALSVIELLRERGFSISSRNIREGLKKTIWPGRMQIVAEEPTIILDGSHNPAAIRAVARSIRTEFKYRRLIIVLGVMKDKQVRQLVRGIVPLSDYVIYTRPVYYRAAEPEILMAEGIPLGKAGEMVPSLTRAIEKAMDIADSKDLILICGSLFTVGEALTYFDPENYRPDNFQ